MTEPESRIPTYVGIVLALAGFALILIGWSEAAGKPNSWQQVPYVLSAGLPGIGLVMVGSVVINVAARRQDGAKRSREMAALTDALHDLRSSIESR
jgi:uncharacterized membrane protein